MTVWLALANACAVWALEAWFAVYVMIPAVEIAFGG